MPVFSSCFGFFLVFFTGYIRFPQPFARASPAARWARAGFADGSANLQFPASTGQQAAREAVARGWPNAVRLCRVARGAKSPHKHPVPPA